MTLTALRGFFAGSGLGALSEAAVVERLLALVRSNSNSGNDGSSAARVRVAYIGTASYDLPEPQRLQTSLLLQRGCEVRAVCVADPRVQHVADDDVEYVLQRADVVLVSGGNSLYAIRRWEEVGLAALLRRTAATRASHVVFAGGSAGALCWFTSGHSDSADPSTYMKASLLQALGRQQSPHDTTPQQGQATTNASSSSSSGSGGSSSEAVSSTSWQYIRVHGLDLLPGMLCPHYDVTQSNGVLRASDFARMLRRHPSERGIGVDHWAVLVLLGNGEYEVFAVPGKRRQCDNDDAANTDDNSNDNNDSGDGRAPGVHVLDVLEGGALQCVRAPSRGNVTSLLRPPRGALVADPFERYYAMANPTPSSGELLDDNKRSGSSA